MKWCKHVGWKHLCLVRWIPGCWALRCILRLYTCAQLLSTRLYLRPLALVLSGCLLLENNLIFYPCDNDSVSWQSTFMPQMSLRFRVICVFFSVFPNTWAADLNNLSHGCKARSDSVQFPLKISKKYPVINKETGLGLLSVIPWSQPRQHCKSVILISVKSIDSSWECRCKIVPFLLHLRN